MSSIVLVCDDQEIFREMIADYLSQKGYKTVTTDNGVDCVTVASRVRPDVIIIDERLPGMRGIDSVEKMRASGIVAPVILITAFADATLLERASQSTHVRVLPKPFRFQQLLAALWETTKPTHPNVLVIDDEASLRSMLTDYLDDQGYEIATAVDGEDGLQKAKDKQYDAIFLDVRMPRRDGISVVTELRERGSTTPVILMSGYSDIGSIARAKELGAADFLRKPFTLQQALSALQRTTREVV